MAHSTMKAPKTKSFLCPTCYLLMLNFVHLLGDLTMTLGDQTSRTSNSSKTTGTKRHGSKPLMSRVG